MVKNLIDYGELAVRIVNLRRDWQRRLVTSYRNPGLEVRSNRLIQISFSRRMDAQVRIGRLLSLQSVGSIRVMRLRNNI